VRRVGSALDDVVGDADAGHPDRRLAALAGHQPRQARAGHEALHALARDLQALAQAQFGLDAA